jgi:putative sporulation protein YyaC
MSAATNLQLVDDPVKTSICVEDPLSTVKLADELVMKLQKLKIARERPKILLCIGTDRSTGDCLGPLVGSKISEKQQDFFIIYGTLDNPVHASNLKEVLDEINLLYREPFIIAVDACLGKHENIGCVTIGNGSLLPGASVNKELPPVGHIHITGIVNMGGFMEYFVLQNTRLNLVMKIADVIAGGLGQAASQFIKSEKTRGG